jgi:hypothetical protein
MKDNVTREIVPEEKYLPVLFLEFMVPLLNPIRHPTFCIVSVVKPKLFPSLVLECLWTLPIIKGRSFSEPSALAMKAYASLTFLPLTPDC